MKLSWFMVSYECVNLHVEVKVRKVEVMSWKPFWGQIEEGLPHITLMCGHVWARQQINKRKSSADGIMALLLITPTYAEILASYCHYAFTLNSSHLNSRLRHRYPIG